MIEITPKMYAHVAAALREAIGTAEWFNGVIDSSPAGIDVADTDDAVIAAGGEAISWRLTLSAIIYRRDEIRPEGPCRPIDEVVPVWWEFSTVDADGVTVPNGFSFGELKPYLKDYE